MHEPAVPLAGNLLLERLLELEAVKYCALLEFDADSYEAAAAEQTHLASTATLDPSNLSRESVIALAKKTRLNFALLMNLSSISPSFALGHSSYTADGVGQNTPKRPAVAQG